MRRKISTTLIAMLVPLWTMGTLKAHGQAPPTPEAVLMQYHIPNTIPGLRAALRNSNPDVRGIVAGLLAEDKDIGSIPVLQQALKEEHVPHVRVSLAAALASLDEAKGSVSLIQLCNDNSLDPTARLLAANRMLDLGSNACLPVVIALMEKEPDPPSRDLGMQYLHRIPSAPPSLLPRLQAVLIQELRDFSPGNRQYASECLSILGDKEAIPPLEFAVSVEEEPPTRIHLEENLKRLKARFK